MDTVDLSSVLADFQEHFDMYYLGAIPKLLNHEGMVLAFVSMLTAIECLAGLLNPSKEVGDRFQIFVKEYFPKEYSALAKDLWKFRNLMVHAFNPMPFRIGCHQSRVHLVDIDGSKYLNAEDFYADLVQASRKYFQNLVALPLLQEAFSKRVAAKGGGRPETSTYVASLEPQAPAV